MVLDNFFLILSYFKDEFKNVKDKIMERCYLEIKIIHLNLNSIGNTFNYSYIYLLILNTKINKCMEIMVGMVNYDHSVHTHTHTHC